MNDTAYHVTLSGGIYGQLANSLTLHTPTRAIQLQKCFWTLLEGTFNIHISYSSVAGRRIGNAPVQRMVRRGAPTSWGTEVEWSKRPTSWTGTSTHYTSSRRPPHRTSPSLSSVQWHHSNTASPVTPLHALCWHVCGRPSSCRGSYAAHCERQATRAREPPAVRKHLREICVIFWKFSRPVTLTFKF